jgi:hypothetical protein
MATLIGVFALTYLLSTVFMDEMQLNTSSVERLVTYRQNMDFSQLMPGALYNGSIDATWAVPDSALTGLEGKSVAVKITASLPENSSMFFPSAGSQAKETSVYLECKVSGNTCANGSVLFAAIQVAATAKPDSEGGSTKISLRSEVVSSPPQTYQAVQQDAGAIFESLKAMFSPNVTVNKSEGSAAAGAENISIGGLNISIGMPGGSAQNGSGNFLDSLKPEGDSRDPLLFLRENPLISILALIIVIVITGAYLLNAKD